MRFSFISSSVLAIAMSLSACASRTESAKPNSAVLTQEDCVSYLSQSEPPGNKQDQAIRKDMACAALVKK